VSFAAFLTKMVKLFWQVPLKKIFRRSLILANELGKMSISAVGSLADRSPIGKLHSAANYTPCRIARFDLLE
jgi:hypothetical protein